MQRVERPELLVEKPALAAGLTQVVTPAERVASAERLAPAALVTPAHFLTPAHLHQLPLRREWVARRWHDKLVQDLSVPITASGTLNVTEVYVDQTFANHGKMLPTFAIALGSDAEPVLKLELTPDLPHAGRLTVTLSGRLQTPSPWVDQQLSPQPFVPTHLPIHGLPDRPVFHTLRFECGSLPHQSSVSLRFEVAEGGDGPERMRTWKSVPFDEVAQEGDRIIRAVAHLRTLEEVDAVHSALSNGLASPALVVHSEARLARRIAQRMLLQLVGMGQGVGLQGAFAERWDAQQPKQVVSLACEQSIPCSYDPQRHPGIYPPREPGSGATLVRHAVGDQLLFQESRQRNLFYFLPDEFRLSRDEVRAPTYRPSLRFEFFPVEVDGMMKSYGIRLGFRAVPYLARNREHEARVYIQGLLPEGVLPVLLPLLPEWCQLQLTLPDGEGNVQSEVRPGANILFSEYVKDHLSLGPRAFEAIFASMRGGSETFSGTVQYRLSGSGLVREIPFKARLDQLVGPAVDAELLSATPDESGAFRIRLSNGLESPVTLKQADLQLLDAAAPGRRSPGELEPGSLPLALEPGQSVELSVRAAIPRAAGVVLPAPELETRVDFPALWLAMLDEPGWDDVVQTIQVSVDDSYFAEPRSQDRVEVVFNHAEHRLALSAAQPSGSARVVRPVLEYVTQGAAAQSYFYQVEVWRALSLGEAPVLVARSEISVGSGAALSVEPPLV